MTDSDKTIYIDKVSKSYGSKQVLKDISIAIEKGEIFGLLGPSGAGKTTLIKILTGQLSFAGQARLMNTDCKNLGKETYELIGMQLDNCGIYERLSCYDNLLIFARIHGINRKMIREVLTYVGLKNGKDIAGKLSKGMLQRLVLARAILHAPKVLFLDEPTSGLDPVNTLKIHNLLLDLKKQGVTVFLTTHNMEEAHKLCDHIALLNDGNIVEYGEPEALCRKYNTDHMITILYRDGSTVLLKNEPASAETIAQAFACNSVESIHSSEPTLETVFIKLTGRGLSA